MLCGKGKPALVLSVPDHSRGECSAQKSLVHKMSAERPRNADHADIRYGT